MYKNEKDRIEKLLKTNIATKSDYEKATANYNVTLHKVDQYNADIEAEKISSQVIEQKIKKLKINLKKIEAEK